VDSRDGSCSRSQSDHVRGRPPIVEVQKFLTQYEATTKLLTAP
jgi:hypothetical protein